MLKRQYIAVPALVLVVCVTFLGSYLPPTQAASVPKLVVLVVVDQMRADYLQQYDAQISGGFRRLTTGGAVFTEAYYPYASTETAQGHALMLSGMSPSLSGMVGDTWYDRQTHATVNAGESTVHKLVGGGSGGGSPEQLLVHTLGDFMKERDGRSLVMSAAWKRYSAVLMGGHHADAAYWFDTSSGHMVTSDYYLHAYPNWVDSFNAAEPTAVFFGKEWLGHKLGLAAAPDQAFRMALRATPYANDILLDFSGKLLANTSLGRDDVPDVLAVSFAATDYVGHTYGPGTPEMENVFLQMDRQLGALMQMLDDRVGAGNWTMVLVADHGAPMPPETVKAQGGDAGRIDARAFREAVVKELSATLPDADHLIEAVEAPEFYLNYSEGARRGLDAATLERAFATAVQKQPGVATVFTRSQILAAGPDSDPVLRAVANGFYAGRSGDIYIVLKPNYMFWGAQGIQHGTPYEYDQHVPLIFYGMGVATGKHTERVLMNDLAPTLGELVGVTIPRAPGHALKLQMLPRGDE